MISLIESSASSGSSGPSPYTFDYADQINQYTVNLITVGVPFTVATQPIITTEYSVLKITDASKCATTINGVNGTITVLTPIPLSISPDTSICLNSSAQLKVSGGTNYQWSPAALLDNPNIANPLASPITNTKFFVSGMDVNNCAARDSVLVTVVPKPVFNAPTANPVCKGQSLTLNGNNGNKTIYSWLPTAGLDNPASSSPMATPGANTFYQLTVSDANCSQYDSVFDLSVVVKPVPILQTQKSNDIDCATPTSRLTVSGANTYTWSPAAGLNDSAVASPVASLRTTTLFTVLGMGVNGCQGSDTITVNVGKTGQNAFSLPNAFSPNNDNINDCFGVRSWGSVTLIDFSIYNRWGQRVFETTNPSVCWDGRLNGVAQDQGNFVYIIKATSFCGNVERKGNLLLIR